MIISVENWQSRQSAVGCREMAISTKNSLLSSRTEMLQMTKLTITNGNPANSCTRKQIGNLKRHFATLLHFKANFVQEQFVGFYVCLLDATEL